MMMRFLQTTVFVVSAVLFGTDCSRVSDANDVPTAQPPTPTPEFIDPRREWNNLTAGNSAVSSDVRSALNHGADEEALARNPRISLEERVASTVSQARHQRLALGQYNEALRLLDGCADDCETVRVRIRRKTAVLSLSLEALEGMNRRVGF